MKRVLGVFLGILTAIGGFVDMGDLVANAAVGARFDMNLAWVVLVGVVGIVVYAEMSGRVAAICGRPVFDLVRERLGPRFGLANLVASFVINLLTLTAEIAGVAIAMSLVAERQLPAARAVRRRARVARRVAAAVRDDGARLRAARPVPARVRRDGRGRSARTGASCGRDVTSPHVPAGRDAVHLRLLRHRPVRRGDDALRGVLLLQRRGRGRLDDRATSTENRANVLIGFPLGGLLSLAIMACAHLVLAPADIGVDQLSQVALPVAAVVGKLGLAVALIGIFAATFGAALETSLSAGYTVAQYLGWPWGKHLRPREASRFHVVILLAILAGDADRLQRRRPGQGHGVLDRAVGRRAAADVLPDPRHRQRPRATWARSTPTAGSSTPSPPSTSSSSCSCRWPRSR